MASTTLKLDSAAPVSRQRLIVELTERLGKAEAVLHSLHDAKAQAEQQCKDLKRQDAMKSVTGVSAIERAIAATSRMVDLLKREISEARKGGSLAEMRPLAGLGSLTLVG